MLELIVFIGSITSMPWAVRLSWLENSHSRPLLFSWQFWPVK